MSSYIRDRVFVLQRESFREHDRRYVMYGREHGLMTAVARGASSASSKQAGHVEPFGVADVMIAKGHVFDKLAVAKDCTSSVAAQRFETLAAHVIMGSLCQGCVRLTRPGMADVALFHLLCDMRFVLSSFEHEPSIDRSEFLFSAGMMKMLDVLGFGPSMVEDKLEDDALRRVLLFLRHHSLHDILRLTVPVNLLRQATHYIEESLKHTPLAAPLHRPSMFY